MPVVERSTKETGKRVKHKTVSAATTDELRRMILEGILPGGHQLRQDVLAEELGVSRIPIREALLQLEAEGLVRSFPHRGAVVSELSIDEIKELFELRVLIEPRLLLRSAPKLTEEDFSKLDAVLSEYSAEMRADHVSRWGELNTEFHLLLYRHAARPRSNALVATLLQECDRHTRIQLALTGGMQRAEAEHAELVELCREGRALQASSLLRRHIKNVEGSLTGFLGPIRKG